MNMNKIQVPIEKNDNPAQFHQDIEDEETENVNHSQTPHNKSTNSSIKSPSPQQLLLKYEYGDRLSVYPDEFNAKSIKNGDKFIVRHVDITSKNANQILKELRILRLSKHHDSLRKLMDIIPPCNLYKMDQISMIFEHTDTTLDKILYSDQFLTMMHIQYILYQILSGLKYLHSFNIYHGHIRPHNIFINENTTIKLSDIKYDKSLKSQFQYTAPEILLFPDKYDQFGMKGDIWSVGCVVAELYHMLTAANIRYWNRKPLFNKPSIKLDNIQNYMDSVFQIIGTPTQDDMVNMNMDTSTFNTKPKCMPCDLYSLFPGCGAVEITVLISMLQFDPEKRLNIEQSLGLPFISHIVDMQREKEYTEIINKYNKQKGESVSKNFCIEEYRPLFVKEGLECSGMNFIVNLVPFIVFLFNNKQEVPMDVIKIIVYFLCV